jgi:hypothetical protein
MARRRKTKSEKAQEWETAQRRVWNEFRPKLANLKSFAEAELLVQNEAPPPDSPGRSYYSNLGFFLSSFMVPAQSNVEERKLYLQFIQRLIAAGEVMPEIGNEVEDALRRAISEP